MCAVVVLFTKVATSDWNFAGGGGEGGGRLVIMERSEKMTEIGLQVGDSVRFRES